MVRSGDRLKTGIAILLGLLVLFSSMGIAKADGRDGGIRMNVVFVLDQSGSMAYTDADALRYEAVELFMGLAADKGNYMGAVVFDDSIVLQKDIVEINGKTSKEALAGAIRGARGNGDTDIGKALDTAVRMLESSANEDIPSAIILLSDGNTDLPKDTTGELLEASERGRERAVQSAKEKGISIYTICLNANGEANVSELSSISDATGGSCVEVRNAEDIKDVFSQFYNIIYRADTINLEDTIIPGSGELEISFGIPVMGVEEANIIINTLSPDTVYSLVNPDGYECTRAEMQEMEIRAKTFTVIKIPGPKRGTWVLRVRGVPGDQIRIDLLYNLLLTIHLEMDPSEDPSGTPSDNVTLKAQLVNDGSVVTDMQVYEGYPIKLFYEDIDSGRLQEEWMVPGNSEVVCTLQGIEAGSYNFYACCTVDDVEVKSNAIKRTIREPEPDPTMKPESDPTTESEPDPDLPIKDWEKTVKEILIIVLAVVAVLCAILLLKYLRSIGLIGKRLIRGKIQCWGFNQDPMGASTTFEGEKGRMWLGRRLSYARDVGVDLGSAYLIAGEKDSYIYLISKKGYYTDRSSSARSKKIRLDANMDIKISRDNGFSQYLQIRYIYP